MNSDRKSSNKEKASTALYLFLAEKLIEYQIARQEYTSGYCDLIELPPGSKRQVRAAISAGVDPCYAEKHSLLFLVVGADDLASAKYLVKCGAVIDEQVLYAADSPQMLQFLVAQGGDLHALDSTGLTLLCHAAAERWKLPPDAVPEFESKSYGTFSTDILVSMGCDPFKRSVTGFLPIDFAWKRKRNIAEYLLQRMNPGRKLIDQQDIDGTTVLIRAVLANQIDRVKDLVAQGADLCILDAQGRSALTISIQSRFAEIETLLMAHGAEYSPLVSIESETQLMEAARLGYAGNCWSALQQGINSTDFATIFALEHSRLIPLFFRSMALAQGSLGESWNVDLVDSWLNLMRKLERAKALLQIAKAKYPEDDWLEENEWALDDLNHAGTCWYLRTEVLPTTQVDRRGSMLSGPFFTSNDFPWPLQLDGLLGSPIVQLDLAPISQLRALPFGDGLLQVFDCGYNNSVVRVIPREEVDSALMTEPCLDAEKYDYSGLGSESWLEDKIVDQIIGFKGPYFSCHASHEPTNSDTPAEIVELERQMGKIAEKNNSGFHLFGTFYPVQYRAFEVPEVLLSLDSGHGFTWGDAGTAQVFYRFNEKNEPSFSFEWSCY